MRIKTQSEGGGGTAEAAAVENLTRAERAEYRERAHQEKWAAAIYRMRQEVKA
jgi:hypothetical protein